MLRPREHWLAGWKRGRGLWSPEMCRVDLENLEPEALSSSGAAGSGQSGSPGGVPSAASQTARRVSGILESQFSGLDAQP